MKGNYERIQVEIVETAGDAIRTSSKLDGFVSHVSTADINDVYSGDWLSEVR